VRIARWPAGAYSLQPRVTRVDDTYRGKANIECWLGTPDELLSVLEAAGPEDSGPEQVEAAVTWLDGTRSRFRGTAAARAGLTEVEAAEAASIELEVTREDTLLSLHATVGSVPGLSVEVVGSDQHAVGNVCGEAYRRMMIGYVDRLRGWRSLALMLVAIGPIAFLGLVSPSPASVLSSLLVFVCAAIWVALSFLLIGPKLLAAKPFKLVAKVDRTAALRRAKDSAQSARSSVRAWLVGTIAGIVTLSVLANLLTDAVRRVFQALF
jgi:hypothetical protein